jgi:hypothetical protein
MIDAVLFQKMIEVVSQVDFFIAIEQRKEGAENHEFVVQQLIDARTNLYNATSNILSRERKIDGS